MSKRRKTAFAVTQHTLRAAFDILDRQLTLADDDLRTKAIHEFGRQLTTRWTEHIDRMAQANGISYDAQLDRVHEQIKSWTAAPPTTR